MDNIKFELKANIVDELEAYSSILNKTHNEILNDALEQYFENEQIKLQEKNQNDENGMTNLDFDEFWQDVQL
jgi:hypothetical protein